MISRFIRQIAIFVPILFVAAACSNVASYGTSAVSRHELDEQARLALNALYDSTPKAKELSSRAAAILVFPDIVKGGLVVGGAEGNGVLLSPKGTTLGYYNVAGVSYGLQAGVQTFSEAMFMMDANALNELNSSDGWSIGSGPSVVVMNSGMAKDFTTTTAQSDVYAFIYGQQGLMAGLGVQGQKITRLSR